MRRAITEEGEGDLSKASQLTVRDASSYKFFPTIAEWLASLGNIPPVRDFFRANAAILAELYADDKNYEALYSHGGQALERMLAEFVLQVSTDDAKSLIEPLLASLQESPDKCARFLELITLVADRTDNAERFWAIWHLYATALQTLPAQRLSRRDGTFASVIKCLFMVVDLKEGIERWHLLAGNEHRIVDLFSKLPSSRSTVGLFLEYLRTTGKHVLEAGLVAFEGKLQNHEDLLTARNVGALELLLGPAIYSTPARLKRDRGVRTAVLTILDAMINAGSTAAYFMRNDFATPYVPS